jgi:hypothetical protein
MTEKHNSTITLTSGMDIYLQVEARGEKKLPKKQHNKTSARLTGTSR